MKNIKRIAVYPYETKKNESMNLYMINIQRILEKRARLYPYEHGNSNFLAFLNSQVLFLNWFETDLTVTDRIKLIFARILGKEVVWTFHNKVPHDCSDLEKEQEKICFMIRVSSTIIVLSKNSVKYLLNLSDWSKNIKNKIVYVPHVNYCSDYYSYKSEGEASVDKSFVFLYFGQIRPYKNLEFLIEAFCHLNDKDIKLIIAGKPVNGKYAKKIEKLCSGNNRIELDFRFIPNRKVYQYMQRGDVVVLPYNKKSSMNSGAMIAAFSCKKPVIIPDIAMAKDYINREFVYIYEYQSDEQHISQLCKVMRQAYIQGKDNNKFFGEQAYFAVKLHNSESEVERSLQKIWKKRKVRRLLW